MGWQPRQVALLSSKISRSITARRLPELGNFAVTCVLTCAPAGRSAATSAFSFLELSYRHQSPAASPLQSLRVCRLRC